MIYYDHEGTRRQLRFSAGDTKLSRFIISPNPGKNYVNEVKSLRKKLGLTQQQLAEEIHASFPTVNRWENGKSRPTLALWKQLLRLEERLTETPEMPEKIIVNGKARLDFTSRPDIVKVIAEGERLSFGHLMNPAFASEISNIDPLPHQRIAVYDHLLTKPRLRFLLADDAGAGKTIMSGLYIREMLSRRLLNRILIVTPAGLTENWRSELQQLFHLHFHVIRGADARKENPFSGNDSHRLIVSVDTLAGDRMYSRLSESDIQPYDLVIFDEAHKLSANRESDGRIRRTDRYALAEALAGVQDRDNRKPLTWNTPHLLLLTATPHMGKDYPYYALWRLLEPEILSTEEAFEIFPRERRADHFLRRTKEEMVHLDGRPLYPQRISDTLSFQLTEGPVSEQALYDKTTDYLRFVYNKAKMLNREAARLAMSVFQRRLASSTYALLRSMERRTEKLDEIIRDVQEGRITTEQLAIAQQKLGREADPWEEKTADEEETMDGEEENEYREGELLKGVVAASLADLFMEKEQVNELLNLARKVYDSGQESKFEKLNELLSEPGFKGEKFLIFTEHKDTLDFLVRRLSGIGFTEKIAQIHGGLDAGQRQAAIRKFKAPVEDGGSRILISTDAGGEGINLQFCWIMVNYDIPWNPARLEQRMGRIHRYGQKHDPVVILNLVSLATREGRVLHTLLTKLEAIRKELNSDKVFDCIGRTFSGVSLKQYMEEALTGDPEAVVERLGGSMTKEQVIALQEKEKVLYGSGGDVATELPRIRESLDRETYIRLLPGYTRHYMELTAPLIDIHLEAIHDEYVTFRPEKPGALDPLLPALESYPEEARDRLSYHRPADNRESVWMHPGEPVFEHFRATVEKRFGNEAKRGAVLCDPTTDKPYLFHLARYSVLRSADPDWREFSNEEVLECRLIGLRQYEGGETKPCAVEHLLLLRASTEIPPAAQRLALRAEEMKLWAQAYVTERIIREIVVSRKSTLQAGLASKEEFIRRGIDYQEAALASRRARHTEKARAGNRKAREALEEVKRRQNQLQERRERALALLRREPDLITPGELKFITHALVVPSTEQDVRERFDGAVEKIAMEIATLAEKSVGAIVKDVHTPDLAVEAGLSTNPGFDLLSTRPDGEIRAIEVKGRAGTADVEITENEWAKACNLRKGYWLYAVYDCATHKPRLLKVQDPFRALLARAKGSLLIGFREVANNAIEK